VRISGLATPELVEAAVNLELDGLHRLVRRNGIEVRLGPTGFRIIALLAKSPDGLGHEALYERV
jgi:DNA-binding response OmpR family regulator